MPRSWALILSCAMHIVMLFVSNLMSGNRRSTRVVLSSFGV
jgi:hypothetical protein